MRIDSSSQKILSVTKVKTLTQIHQDFFAISSSDNFMEWKHKQNSMKTKSNDKMETKGKQKFSEDKR